MVSHLSYCQYPTVKVIGKDTLVLMTLKQGQDINQKFMDLTNDIQTLRDSLNRRDILFTKLQTEKDTLFQSLSLLSVKTKNIEEENMKLKILLADRENTYEYEKKKWAGWMFFSAMMTVLVGALK